MLLAPERTGIREIEGMRRRYKELAAHEHFSIIEELRAVPNSRRGEHFIGSSIGQAIGAARAIERLKPDLRRAKQLNVDAESLNKRISNYAITLEKSSEALDRLRDELGENTPKVAPCKFRGDESKSAGGRQ